MKNFQTGLEGRSHHGSWVGGVAGGEWCVVANRICGLLIGLITALFLDVVKLDRREGYRVIA